jgi:hypothetical protein
VVLERAGFGIVSDFKMGRKVFLGLFFLSVNSSVSPKRSLPQLPHVIFWAALLMPKGKGLKPRRSLEK